MTLTLVWPQRCNVSFWHQHSTLLSLRMRKRPTKGAILEATSQISLSLYFSLHEVCLKYTAQIVCLNFPFVLSHFYVYELSGCIFCFVSNVPIKKERNAFQKLKFDNNAAIVRDQKLNDSVSDNRIFRRNRGKEGLIVEQEAVTAELNAGESVCPTVCHQCHCAVCLKYITAAAFCIWNIRSKLCSKCE